MVRVFQALDLEIWQRIFIGCELYLNINIGKIKWYWTHLAQVNIVLWIIKYKYNFQFHTCLHRIEYLSRIYRPEHYLLFFLSWNNKWTWALLMPNLWLYKAFAKCWDETGFSKKNNPEITCKLMGFRKSR